MRIINFFKTGLNIWLTQWTWPLKVGSVIVAIVLLALIVGAFKSCGKKAPVVDLETVNKINNANEKEQKKILQDYVESKAEVTRTADNRQTIAETNVIERNRDIAEKVAEANRLINESKAVGKDVTGPELDCMLAGICGE